MNQSAKFFSCQWLVLLLVFASGAYAQESRRTGSITGRIVVEDGSPTSGAQVFTQQLGGSRMQPSRSQPVVDAEGNFTLNNLEARSYRVMASLPGYVTAGESDPNRVARLGDHVTVNLVKGGVITGRVTNQSGEPVIAINVSVARVRDGEGKAVVGGGGRPAATDDRGIYRAYGLPAGAYLVSADSGQNSFPGSPYLGTVPVFHPSNTRDGATEVTVLPGGEASGIDIRYRLELGHVISGKVSGALPTGNSGVSVRLATLGGQQWLASTYVQTGREQSGFELQGVANGDYEVSAFSIDREGGGAVSQTRRVAVRNADVGGLELALAPLASLSGKIALEPLPALKPEEQALCVKGRSHALAEIVLRANTLAPRANSALPAGFTNSDAAPAEDGSFTISLLEAGQYRLQPNLPGEAWHIKSIAPEAAPKTAKDAVKAEAKALAPNTGVIAVKSGEKLTGWLVTLAEGAAQVSGKLAGKSNGRMRAHLVPADAALADDVLRYAEAVVRSDGTFALTNLAPGKYWLIAKPFAADEPTDRAARPLAWDAAARAALRKAAEAGQQVVELTACMRLSEYKLKAGN